ncbi:hypothetical protein HDU84_004015 [Entophlyctis sp. JEL0112]|nr:hypothetical protein HDU84_004015 [Entophlyctis sp. JEL0112]
MVCTKCEAKLAKLITPAVGAWKDKAAGKDRDKAGPSSGKVPSIYKKNQNKFAPYENKCKLCKSRVHQEKAHYCQGCSYKNGICAMCGVKILDTRMYNQNAK